MSDDDDESGEKDGDWARAEANSLKKDLAKVEKDYLESRKAGMRDKATMQYLGPQPEIFGKKKKKKKAKESKLIKRIDPEMLKALANAPEPSDDAPRPSSKPLPSTAEILRMAHSMDPAKVPDENSAEDLEENDFLEDSDEEYDSQDTSASSDQYVENSNEHEIFEASEETHGQPANASYSEPAEELHGEPVGAGCGQSVDAVVSPAVHDFAGSHAADPFFTDTYSDEIDEGQGSSMLEDSAVESADEDAEFVPSASERQTEQFEENASASYDLSSVEVLSAEQSSENAFEEYEEEPEEEIFLPQSLAADEEVQEPDETVTLHLPSDSEEKTMKVVQSEILDKSFESASQPTARVEQKYMNDSERSSQAQGPKLSKSQSKWPKAKIAERLAARRKGSSEHELPSEAMQAQELEAQFSSHQQPQYDPELAKQKLLEEKISSGTFTTDDFSKGIFTQWEAAMGAAEGAPLSRAEQELLGQVRKASGTDSQADAPNPVEARIQELVEQFRRESQLEQEINPVKVPGTAEKFSSPAGFGGAVAQHPAPVTPSASPSAVAADSKSEAGAATSHLNSSAQAGGAMEGSAAVQILGRFWSGTTPEASLQASPPKRGGRFWAGSAKSPQTGEHLKNAVSHPGGTSLPRSVGREEAQRIEPKPAVQAKVEALKIEPKPAVQAKVEAPKIEPKPAVQAKVEAPKIEPKPAVQAKVEAPKIEPKPAVQAKVEAPKIEPKPAVQAKVEAAKVEPKPAVQAKVEAAKVEPKPAVQAKVEAPKVEPKPAVQAKVEAAKVEPKPAVQAKVEAAKVEPKPAVQAKVEAPKIVPRPEIKPSSTVGSAGSTAIPPAVPLRGDAARVPSPEALSPSPHPSFLSPGNRNADPISAAARSVLGVPGQSEQVPAPKADLPKIVPPKVTPPANTPQVSSLQQTRAIQPGSPPARKKTTQTRMMGAVEHKELAPAPRNQTPVFQVPGPIKMKAAEPKPVENKVDNKDVKVKFAASAKARLGTAGENSSIEQAPSVVADASSQAARYDNKPSVAEPVHQGNAASGPPVPAAVSLGLNNAMGSKSGKGLSPLAYNPWESPPDSEAGGVHSQAMITPPKDEYDRKHRPGTGAIKKIVSAERVFTYKYPDGSSTTVKYNSANVLVEITIDGGKWKRNAAETGGWTFFDEKGRKQDVMDGELDVTDKGDIVATRKDGYAETQFADGTFQIQYPDKRKEIHYPDGTCVLEDSKGNRTYRSKAGIETKVAAPEKATSKPKEVIASDKPLRPNRMTELNRKLSNILDYKESQKRWQAYEGQTPEDGITWFKNEKGDILKQDARDGSNSIYHPDGSWEHIDRNGKVTLHLGDDWANFD